MSSSEKPKYFSKLDAVRTPSSNVDHLSTPSHVPSKQGSGNKYFKDIRSSPSSVAPIKCLAFSPSCHQPSVQPPVNIVVQRSDDTAASCQNADKPSSASSCFVGSHAELDVAPVDGVVRRKTAETPGSATPSKGNFLATPSEKRRASSSCQTPQGSEEFCFKIAVRLCPLFDQQATQAVTLGRCSGIEVRSCSKSSQISTEFFFPHCFSSVDRNANERGSQADVYEHFAKDVLMDSAIAGYNAALFAYGQTGSGKSFSIMGPPDNPGIIPRFCEDIFGVFADEITQKSVSIELSFVEIYCEKLRDLLCTTVQQSRKPALRIREHPSQGIYVENLSQHAVLSLEDLKSWIAIGNRQRATASTAMNNHSSRSHALFTLRIRQTKVQNSVDNNVSQIKSSVINVVDLAGSERDSLQENMKESVSINKSLVSLGMVIKQLAEKRTYISYRDSVLTWLLKDCLGGNAKTAMLATVSPDQANVEETLGTLRYADVAKQIVTRVFMNNDASAAAVKKLKAEIQELKHVLGPSTSSTPVATLNVPKVVGSSPASPLRRRSPARIGAVESEEVKRMRQRLVECEEQLKAEKEARRGEMENWHAKFDEADRQRIELKQTLRVSAAQAFHVLLTFGLDHNFDYEKSELPMLFYLSPDPQFADLVIYGLKLGMNVVGRGSDADVIVEGCTVADHHCMLTVESKEQNFVLVEPIESAKVYVNGEEVVTQRKVYHNDRLVLGMELFFRLSLPNRSALRKVELKFGFLSAQKELLETQFKSQRDPKAIIPRLRKDNRVEMKFVDEQKRQAAELRHARLSNEQHRNAEVAQLEHLYNEKIKKLQEMLAEERKAKDDLTKMLWDKLEQQQKESQRLFDEYVALNQKHQKIDLLSCSFFEEFNDVLTEDLNEPARSSLDSDLNLVVVQANIDFFNRQMKFYEKQFDFSLQMLEGKPVVFVRNLKLRMYCTWTLELFDENILRLREILLQVHGVPEALETMLYRRDYDWESDIPTGEQSPLMSFALANAFKKAKRRSSGVVPTRLFNNKETSEKHGRDYLFPSSEQNGGPSNAGSATDAAASSHLSAVL